MLTNLDRIFLLWILPPYSGLWLESKNRALKFYGLNFKELAVSLYSRLATQSDIRLPLNAAYLSQWENMCEAFNEPLDFNRLLPALQQPAIQEIVTSLIDNDPILIQPPFRRITHTTMLYYNTREAITFIDSSISDDHTCAPPRYDQRNNNFAIMKLCYNPDEIFSIGSAAMPIQANHQDNPNARPFNVDDFFADDLPEIIQPSPRVMLYSRDFISNNTTVNHNNEGDIVHQYENLAYRK